jgi:hypothetical protein
MDRKMVEACEKTTMAKACEKVTIANPAKRLRRQKPAKRLVVRNLRKGMDGEASEILGCKSLLRRYDGRSLRKG